MSLGKMFVGRGVQFPRLICIVLLLVVPSIWGCEKQTEPIKLGFIGGLTGRVADLGVAGRDGMLLAVEEQNRNGGINGRLVTVVARDDGQSGDRARTAFRELVDQHVAAVVGPMTSQMGVVISPLAEKTGTIVVSPTAKALELSGKDDCFFRVIPSLDLDAAFLANHLKNILQYRNIAFVYDLRNFAYSNSWFESFRSAFDPAGTGGVLDYPFRSAPDAPLFQIATEVDRSSVDGIVVIANAIDTAFFFQQLRKIGNRLPGFASQWSFTGDLINYGGKAVEGLYAFHSVNPNHPAPSYRTFVKAFQSRFGYDPSFAGQLSYEATSLLMEALGKGEEDLKKALLGIDSFKGVQGVFRLDSFGDVQRDLFLIRVENGQFKVVDN